MSQCPCLCEKMITGSPNHITGISLIQLLSHLLAMNVNWSWKETVCKNICQILSKPPIGWPLANPVGIKSAFIVVCMGTQSLSDPFPSVKCFNQRYLVLTKHWGTSAVGSTVFRWYLLCEKMFTNPTSEWESISSCPSLALLAILISTSNSSSLSQLFSFSWF